MPSRDTEGQENLVAIRGAPDEWPDVDFGALLLGWRRQSSVRAGFVSVANIHNRIPCLTEGLRPEHKL
jgi:hypothetical protein